MHFKTPTFRLGTSALTALALGFVLAGCDQPVPQAQQPADAAAKQETEAPAAVAPPIIGTEELPPNHPPIDMVEPAASAMPAMPAGHPALPELTASAEADAEAGAEDEEMEHPQPSGADIPFTVPETVQGKWAAVMLEVTGADGEKQEIRAAVGDEIPLTGGQTLWVEAFLPSYISDFEKITSASDELKNPAVKVHLREGTETKAMGWVFQNLPEFNNYRSEQVQVRLLNAEAAAGEKTQ